jgi:hypothetical protein
MGIGGHSRGVNKERMSKRVKERIKIRRDGDVVRGSKDAAVGNTRGGEKEAGQAAAVA